MVKTRKTSKSKPVLPDLPCNGRKSFNVLVSLLRRLSPHDLPVNNIGYLAASTKRAGWPSGGSDFSLSFVFGGEGYCVFNGKKIRVVPPCIFTTWPAIPVEFGPDPGNKWEELYIGYSAGLMSVLKKRRLADEQNPVWPIHDPFGIRLGLARLCRLVFASQVYGQADRIDRLCDSLLTDTLIAHNACLMPDHSEQLIRSVESCVATNLAGRVDFNALAKQNGLSLTHFRRLWRRFYSVPPAHYVVQQRMREACRLLIETDLRVSEIAARVGFKDVYYFSKQFHRLIGRTASEYRNVIKDFAEEAN